MNQKVFSNLAPSLTKVLSLQLILLSVGCHSSPQSSLERVAKDWCLTVRASQLMPVYPLEQDLRPGDVYLVDNTVNTEIKTWNSKGFLPLLNKFDRIPIPKGNYDAHYEGSPELEDAPSYHRAPLAAFPSYSFELDRRGGLSLAVPLNSVPVAMSAVGAQSATGSAVFSGAESQGLPDKDMEQIIMNWGVKNMDILKRRAQQAGTNPLLVRVITRVYRVKGATVTLAFSKASAFSGSVGSAPQSPTLSAANTEGYDAMIEETKNKIALLKGTGGDSETVLPDVGESEPSDDPRIKALQARLNELELKKAENQITARERRLERLASEDIYGGYLLPGASFQTAGRSERGVSMKESFDKPLALGFLAQEWLVSPEGTLLPLGSTLSLMQDSTKFRKEYQKGLDTIKKWAASPNSTRRKKDSGNPRDNPFIN